MRFTLCEILWIEGKVITLDTENIYIIITLVIKEDIMQPKFCSVYINVCVRHSPLSEEK